MTKCIICGKEIDSTRLHDANLAKDLYPEVTTKNDEEYIKDQKMLRKDGSDELQNEEDPILVGDKWYHRGCFQKQIDDNARTERELSR